MRLSLLLLLHLLLDLSKSRHRLLLALLLPVKVQEGIRGELFRLFLPLFLNLKHLLVRRSRVIHDHRSLILTEREPAEEHLLVAHFSFIKQYFIGALLLPLVYYVSRLNLQFLLVLMWTESAGFCLILHLLLVFIADVLRGEVIVITVLTLTADFSFQLLLNLSYLLLHVLLVLLFRLLLG